MNGISSLQSPSLTPLVEMVNQSTMNRMNHLNPLAQLRDSFLSSGLTSDPFNGSFGNLFGNNANALANLGLGSIPGFGGACTPPGSLFGGALNSMGNQEEQLKKLIMLLIMLLQSQSQNGFNGDAANNGANVADAGAPSSGDSGAPSCGGSSGAPSCGGSSGAPSCGGSSGAPSYGGSSGAPSYGGSSGVPSAAPATESSSSAPVSASGNVDVSALSGDDKRTAEFIDSWLEKKGSPAAGQNAGAMMVKYGKEHGVEPLALLSIAGLETQYGKAGIGVNGMLGVGAYDSDPNNATRNPKFSGVENQIKVGAKTFENLLKAGGGNNKMPISQQLEIVGKRWASDRGWAKGVNSVYNEVVKGANKYNESHPVEAPKTDTTKNAPKADTTKSTPKAEPAHSTPKASGGGGKQKAKIK